MTELAQNGRRKRRGSVTDSRRSEGDGRDGDANDGGSTALVVHPVSQLPSLEDTGQRQRSWRIHSLILEDFKSYKGRHVIGPLARFTGIVGPNGAGKSNTLDSICFVLGVRSKYLRCSNLQSLIHHDTNDNSGERPQSGSKGVDGAANTGASVTLVLKNEEGDSLEFARKISPTGTSTVSINGKQITHELYLEELAKLNVLVKAKNFLVLQGDVEEVAQRDPKELAKLLEQASSSYELESEYERLSGEIKRLVNELKFLHLQKDRAQSFKKELEKQAEEVAQYNAKVEQLKEKRQKLAVFSLYANEQAAARQYELMHESKAAAKQIAEQVQRVTEQAHKLEATLQEKKAAVASSDVRIEGCRAKLEATTGELSSLETHLKLFKSELASLTKKREKRYLEIERTKNHLNELEGLLAEAEQQLKNLKEHSCHIAGREPGVVTMTAKQRATYDRASQSAAIETSSLKSKKCQLSSEAQAIEAGLLEAKADLEELERKVESLVQLRERAFEEKQRVEKDAANLQERRCELARKKEELTNNVETLGSQRGIILDKLMQLDSQLQTFRANTSFVEHTRKQKRILQELQEALPGRVLGTLGDLCQPISRRYSVAVSVALGKHLDLVLVDSYKTVKKCIEILKERRLGVLTFAPLDALQAKPIDPRVRELCAASSGSGPAAFNPSGGGRHRGSNVETFRCRPTIDCVEFDPQFEKAFQFALRDSIIADTIEEATFISYTESARRGLRLKCVTLDGEKILKNANIAIDTSARHAATRFDVKEQDRLTEQRQEMARQLEQLQDLRSLQSQLTSIEAEMQQIESDLSIATPKQQLWARKVHEHDDETARFQQQIDAYKLHLTAHQTKLDGTNLQLDEIDAMIGAIEEVHFGALSRELGIKDLRKFEETMKKEKKKQADAEAAMQRKVDRLRSEIEALQAQLEPATGSAAGSLAATDMQIADLAETVRSDEERLKELEAKKAAEEAEFDAVSAERNSVHAEVFSLNSEIQKVKKEIRNLEGERTKAKTAVLQAGQQLETLTERAHQLLKQTLLDNVSLPLVSGSMDSYKKLLGLSDSQLSQSQPVSRVEEDTEPVVVDYDSVLDDIWKERATSAEARTVEEEIEHDVVQLKLELDRKRPNLKAVEKLSQTQTQLKDLDKSIHETSQQKLRQERLFNEVKAERTQRYMRCFLHTQHAIDVIYSKLTAGIGGSEGHHQHEESVGGQAFLDLEEPSSDEPFKTGVLFHAIPPSKRFRDMRQLSGGEKTMAALALLFALQHYRPSPFLVLDEIDAALDPKNVRSLSKFMRSVDFQCIVVSLKDRLFGSSDLLIGVYKDEKKGSSGVLHLDLTSYPSLTSMGHGVSRRGQSLHTQYGVREKGKHGMSQQSSKRFLSQPSTPDAPLTPETL